MTQPRVFLADAFTSEPGAGNPAHVLLCPVALDAARRLELTRALGHCDAGFLTAQPGATSTVELSFCTPRGPAPFVAHVSLAAHAIRAHLGLPPADRQQLPNGEIVRVEQRASGRAPQFALHVPVPPLGRELEPREVRSLLRAVGSTEDALDRALPAHIAGGASQRLLLGLRDRAALAALRPDRQALLELSTHLGVGGVFCYARLPPAADTDVEARMFAPALGLDEDAVSGNAYGMLAVSLWRRGLLRERAGVAMLRGAQGRFLDRPGEARIELAVTGSGVTGTAIIGHAVVVGELACPAIGACA